MSNTKRYPFSMKNAHSIELYHNHLFNLMRSMEKKDIPWDEDRYDRAEKMYEGQLAELMDAIYSNRNPYVVYLNGAQIGLAKRIVFWASNRRADSLEKAGKTEYIQYC